MPGKRILKTIIKRLLQNDYNEITITLHSEHSKLSIEDGLDCYLRPDQTGSCIQQG